MELLLLTSVFVVATCGLVYELVAGTLASYLLGDSVFQFSTVIGAYLFAMGVGSYLSRFVQRHLISVFIQAELLIGIVGGFSAVFLFVMFEHVEHFRVLLYTIVFIVGVLVGLEIPLLMRILKDRLEFANLVSKVLSFDYVGALLASVAFPLVLAPHLGLARTALLFGIFNVVVAMAAIAIFRRDLPWFQALRVSSGLVLSALLIGFVYAERIVDGAEGSLYPDDIVYSKSSQYQRIVVTKGRDDIRLYLNSHLQFSSRDEYRYHEALVHPAMTSAARRERILVLGGGDGLAIREILRYPEVRHIQLVDLDPAMTKLFQSFPPLSALNQQAFSSPLVHVANRDAFVWIRESKEQHIEPFDVVIIDFPDPTNYSIGKLYTTRFYQDLRFLMHEGSVLTVQSTSPLFARKSFWCVAATLEHSGFVTAPYHAYVPSFGEWGFVLAGAQAVQGFGELPEGLKFLTADVRRELFDFPPDMTRIAVNPNRLNNQALVHYYESEWSQYSPS